MVGNRRCFLYEVHKTVNTMIDIQGPFHNPKMNDILLKIELFIGM